MATKPTAKPAPVAAKTQVAEIPKTGTSIATNTPSFMQQYAGQGTENIGAQDMETPRIKLLQALSPECEQFDEARPGHFWHTIAQVSLGTSLTVVPVYTDIRAILWNPRESGGGILARSDDLVTWSPDSGEFAVKVNKGTKAVTWKLTRLVAQSRLLEWGSSDPDDGNSQPAATKMYNIVLALPDYPDLPPAVVTLQRSSVGVAKKFLGQLKMIRGAPSYGCKFNMSSTDVKNKQSQSFKNFQFAALGMVEDEEEFHRYRSMYETFKSMGLQIKDIDGLADDDAEEGTAGPADPNAPKY